MSTEQTREGRLAAFGRALRELREAAQLTQGELAERVSEIATQSVSQASISAWEAGRWPPQKYSDVWSLEDALSAPRGFLSRHLGFVPPSDENPGPASIFDAIDNAPELNAGDKETLANVARVMIQANARATAAKRGRQKRPKS